QSKVNSNPEYVSDEDMIAEMQKLLRALKKSDIKINKLDQEVRNLKNEKDALYQTNMLLADENDILKNDNEKLYADLDKIRKENNILKDETKKLNNRLEDLSQSLNNTFNKFNDNDKKSKHVVSITKIG